MTMRSNTGDNELLNIQAETLFVLTDSGRIKHENDPERSAGPRMYLARCESGSVVRLRHDVGDELAQAIRALVGDEPPLTDPISDPVHLDEYVRILGSESAVEQQASGLIYVFPANFHYEHELRTVRSETAEGDRLMARMDARMSPELAEVGFRSGADFWEPWCAALIGDEIASLCITARLGRAGAEAGVTTVPAQRGQGFGAAATAGWATHPAIRGRTRFYGHDRANTSSQRVASRLGLRILGASLRIT